MAFAMRTRFDNILTEFLPPAPGKSNGRERVIILCDGMPTMPSKGALLKFLSDKGYWVFYPRYRGSWESGGKFLARPCDDDIRDVIDGLVYTFTDAWSDEQFKLFAPEVTLLASSFGGATALLASRDPRVKRVVAFSPVVDWRSESRAEPLDFLERFTEVGFGNGYRPVQNAWKKLASGLFFNPAVVADQIDGSKLLLFHSRDDESVPWKPVCAFSKKTGARLILLKRAGHMGLNTTTHHWKRIARFLK